MIIKYKTLWHHKIYMGIFLLLAYYQNNAQNLIPNSGFEEKETKSYDKSGKFFRVKDWDWIQPQYNYGWWHTPWSGLHIDKTMLPYLDSLLKKENNNAEKAYISVYPYEGNCYIRSLGSKFKNIIQTKLKQPLKKGVLYYFEMYYRVDGISYKNKKADLFSINRADFGLFFRDKNSFEIPFIKKLSQNEIILKPQIRIMLNDSLPITQWSKFTAYFIPTKNYNYLLIGNFKDLGKDSPDIWQGISSFNIDNLLLTPYENIVAENLKLTNQAFTIEGIYFNDNSPEISGQSVYTLHLLEGFLKNNPNKKLEINCYTTGNINHVALSKQRADAIADFIIKKGIKSNRIITNGKKDCTQKEKNFSGSEQSEFNKIEIIVKL